MTSANIRRRLDEQANAYDAHRERLAVAGNHSAVCESCDRPLFAGVDRWEEQPVQDADGVTTFTICEACVEAGS